MERLVCIAIGYVLRTLSDRIYFGKDLSYRYPETGKRKSRLYQCAAYTWKESRSTESFV